VVARDAVERLAAMAGLDVGQAARYDWAAVERSLAGLRLPSDYKRLVDTFPDGKFRDLVKVVRPESDDDYLGYAGARLDDMRGFRDDGDGEFPDPIFPEEGGLLPWGFGPSGELFFWLTKGDDPDRWPVLWADTYFYDWFRYDMSMSEFLIHLVDDLPPDVAEIAQTDLADSVPFRAFGPPPAPTTTYRAEPMVSGRWVPENAQERALADTLEAMYAAVPARVNEVAELLAALPQTGSGGRLNDWPALEQALGIALPADYKTFYDALGAGVFCDLTILGPDPAGPYSLGQALTGLRDRIARTGQSMMVTAFPEPRGVLPWAYAPDGRIYCWRVVGTDPDAWYVTLVTPRFTVLDNLDRSFSSFLLAYSGVRDQIGLSEYDGPKWTVGPVFRGRETLR